MDPPGSIFFLLKAAGHRLENFQKLHGSTIPIFDGTDYED